MNFKNENEALRVLGLRQGSSENDVKTAYRNLLKLYHPDNSKGDFVNQRYYEIQDAYHYLENYFLNQSKNNTDNSNNVRGAENFNVNFSQNFDGIKKGYSANGSGASGTYQSRAGRIIGDSERPKEMHYQKVSRAKSIKADEARRKKQAENLKKRQADAAYEEAMEKIHAIRAAERAAKVIEAMMHSGN